MFSIEADPIILSRTTSRQGALHALRLGHRWAIDTGYANEHEPNGRGRRSVTVAFSLTARGPSGAGLGTNGTIAHYENNDRYGYALADCTEAYNRNNKEPWGSRHAKRHAYFVYPRNGAPAYAVVEDDIRKDDQPHDFVWQMIYADQMALTLQDGHATLSPTDTSSVEVETGRLAGAVRTVQTDGAEPRLVVQPTLPGVTFHGRVEPAHGPAAFPRPATVHSGAQVLAVAAGPVRSRNRT
jgi:hypothetical protein